MGGEHPPAEAVDGGDPGPLDSLEDDAQPLELLALRHPLARCKLVSDPAPQLIRGALCEGEGEDAARPDLRVERRGAEALDEDGGLAGPGPRAQEHVAVPALDGGALLIGPLGAHSSSPSSDHGSSSGSPRSRRQIGWKLHQSGQLPPSGSRITFPAWTEAMTSSAFSLASSSAPWNAWSSRWSLGRGSRPASSSESAFRRRPLGVRSPVPPRGR